MEKLKNFWYNTSDICVALIIILISIAVVGIKMGNIMDYPNLSAEFTNKHSSENKPNENFGLAVPVDDGKLQENNTSIDNTAQTDNKNTKNEKFAIYVNYGESLQSIADKFVSVGLFESREEFIKISEEMQASSSIKAGNFIIPADASKKEVMSILVTAPSN